MYIIEGDLRLERQGNALIVHSKHNARWFGALVGGFALFFLSAGLACPIRVGFPCLATGSAIGVMLLGIGIFLSLPREVTTTLLLPPRRPSCEHRPWLVRASPHLCLRGDCRLASERVSR